MKIRLLVLCGLLSLLMWLGSARVVQADGIIVPQPCVPGRCPPPRCFEFICPPEPRPLAQLEIKYHQVDVTIIDQLAITKVDQVFYNPNDWAVEGTYLFPLPAEAVASGFKLWMDDSPVEGKLLDATEARRVYEETVRSLRDPALLEYKGRGAFQASIFPIPPKGERRIQLEYSQALKADNGLVNYTYPLNTEKFSQRPLDRVSVKVDLRDGNGLRAVYSPSHTVDIKQDGAKHALVSYEAKKVLPDADFSLYFSTGGDTGMHLLTYRDPGDAQDGDGFFLLLLAPGAASDVKVMPKDVLLVLDHSGSMEGEKLKQAKEALSYILKQLNPQDRFYLETFSTGVSTYASGLSGVGEVPNALQWVDSISSTGSTDINRALLEAAAVAQPERPTYLIFLTDGLPTTGETTTQKILDNFLRSAPKNLRLFSFGVGYDVDTVLLDSLSSDHAGLSSYVKPRMALDEVLSSFYEKISQPVMTDLKLDFGGLRVFDLYPQPLPDLFAGSQVLLAGRYRDGGKANLSLQGSIGGQTQVLHFDGQEFAQDSRSGNPAMAAVARIWASRKIGALLNQVRIDGPNQETIDQIVRLSVRYGIVTPYTSYLVTEANPLGADAQQKIAENAFDQAKSAPLPAAGQGAVDRAAEEGQLQAAQAAPTLAAVAADGENQIRVVGSRTFVLVKGVWLDTSYDPQKMMPTDLTFLSSDYLKLADSRPDVAAALALGEKIVLVVDGKAYRVVADGNSTGSVTATATPAPDATLAPKVTPTLQSVPRVTMTTPPEPQDLIKPFCLGGMLLAGIAAALRLLIRV